MPRPPAKAKAAPRNDAKAKPTSRSKPRFSAEARSSARAQHQFVAKVDAGAKADSAAKAKPRFGAKDGARAKARPRFDAEARSNAKAKPRFDAKAGPRAKAKPRFDAKADPRAAFKIKPTAKAKPAPRAAIKNQPKPKADLQPRVDGKPRTIPRVKPAKAKPSSAQALLSAAAKILDDGKAEDLITIDLRGKSDIADYLLIATGNSQRQIAALSQHLITGLKAGGFGRIQSEGVRQGEWVLIDAGDVIVHLFRPETRSHYNLEKMWGAGLDAVVGQD